MKYVYRFVNNGKVEKVSVNAEDKVEAIMKARELRPEALHAGRAWVCLGENEGDIIPDNHLLYWAKSF